MTSSDTSITSAMTKTASTIGVTLLERVLADTTTTTTTTPNDNNETSTPMEDDDDDESSVEIFTSILSNTFLFLLIFGMSATVDTKKIMKQLNNKFAIATGVGMQFIIMPFLGFVAIKILQNEGLTEPMGLTLLIVTASPGGSYSNWFCSTFNADLALSVAMTALSTILSTVLLPANLVLYAHATYGVSQEGEESILDSVDFSALFTALVIVIVAILTGLFASYKNHNPTFQRRANRLGSISGILLIVSGAVIAATAEEDEDGEDSNMFSYPWSFYLGVAFPCLVGLAVANVLGRVTRLEKPEIVTIAVECSYQNVGIATTAAVNMFNDPRERAEALFVPLFYGAVEAVVLGIYCLVAWKLGWTKAPPDENFCVMVSKTYEVIGEDEEGNNNGDQHPDGSGSGTDGRGNGNGEEEKEGSGVGGGEGSNTDPSLSVSRHHQQQSEQPLPLVHEEDQRVVIPTTLLSTHMDITASSQHHQQDHEEQRQQQQGGGGSGGGGFWSFLPFGRRSSSSFTPVEQASPAKAEHMSHHHHGDDADDTMEKKRRLNTDDTKVTALSLGTSDLMGSPAPTVASTPASMT